MRRARTTFVAVMVAVFTLMGVTASAAGWNDGGDSTDCIYQPNNSIECNHP